MSTRYYTEVSNELLDEIRSGKAVMPTGFRLVREIGPIGMLDSTLVEFEDDAAPQWMAGRIVSPSIRVFYPTDGTPVWTEVFDRHVERRCRRFCDLAQGEDDAHLIQFCRILPGITHHIHVGEHGYYRWDDAGKLIPTPHWSDLDFDALYRADPTGQTPWEGNKGHDPT